MRFLPSAACKVCNNSLVTNLQKGVDDEGMMPERAFCGHWFHYKCFGDYVAEPPYKRECPHEGCSMVMASPDFACDPSAVKNREKKWLQKQQHDSEQDQLSQLFGI